MPCIVHRPVDRQPAMGEPPLFGWTTRLSRSATVEAPGRSKPTKNAGTLRVARSMGTDTQGLPMTRRVKRSTISTSASVWSICTISSGHVAPKLPRAFSAAGCAASSASSAARCCSIRHPGGCRSQPLLNSSHRLLNSTVAVAAGCREWRLSYHSHSASTVGQSLAILRLRSPPLQCSSG